MPRCLWGRACWPGGRLLYCDALRWCDEGREGEGEGEGGRGREELERGHAEATTLTLPVRPVPLVVPPCAGAEVW